MIANSLQASQDEYTHTHTPHHDAVVTLVNHSLVPTRALSQAPHIYLHIYLGCCEWNRRFQ